MYFLKVKSCSF